MLHLWCCVGGTLAIIDGSGRKARDRIEHFLCTAIDNDNTRRAYGRALKFFAFLEDGGRERVQDIGPLDVGDYLEAAKANGLSTATLKLHMAAIRKLFDHLVTGGVLEHSPALSVKAPRQKLGKGKTPILAAEEAGDLLRSIETDTIVGSAAGRGDAAEGEHHDADGPGRAQRDRRLPPAAAALETSACRALVIAARLESMLGSYL